MRALWTCLLVSTLALATKPEPLVANFQVIAPGLSVGKEGEVVVSFDANTSRAIDFTLEVQLSPGLNPLSPTTWSGPVKKGEHVVFKVKVKPTGGGPQAISARAGFKTPTGWGSSSGTRTVAEVWHDQ